jgi:hypothetical protein
MHRNVERDQAGLADWLFTERLAGEVEAGDRCAARPKPRRRRRQPEWLVAKLIGRNENNLHRSRLDPNLPL